ncbi:hypothetical protein SAMN06265337_3726 [Hymenobacter gelipurpurascens]|uniref:GyrI-like small molecule binding domain-containing protein n=1 Tax=Hymenobacter gelipurpurascens TaxID=89968 RepID=A0A212UFW4_9BACT|nr:hypothetical protein [Hymenobacter gelipurpurascens]SNC77149.1 hypothetical protein SAMN06265337_3726 [Hymenobacter gelipurpurascens]
MNRIFLALSLILGIGFTATYWKMGGFKAATVTPETLAQPYFVAGHYYEGPANDEAFGELTRRAYELRRTGKIRGDFGNIFYNSPEDTRTAAKVFVGLVVADTTQKLPADYKYRVFPAGQKVLHAHIDAGYMVAPDKLYGGIKDFAKENKLTLQDIYLERFPEKGEPEVVAVLK